MVRKGDGDAPSLDRDEEVSDLARDERKESRARVGWLRRRVDPADREQALGRLFFEGDGRKRYFYRFALLQTVATVVAVLGVVGGSPTIVIGAMLLAPLMTPVLALAAALAMGWPKRAFKAGIMVALATAASVAVSWLTAAIIPVAPAASLSSELLSRTHPSLIDLVVALAAGIAGGYSLVREEVGTSLPGVAVAVALVPPLAVIGASLELGRTDLAQGALLLYLVNLTAIVFASGAVFLATGFIPAVRISRLSSRVIVTIVVSAVMIGLLAIPLTKGLQDAIRQDRHATTATEVVQTWLGTRNLEVTEVVVEGDTVTVELVGEEPPPAAEDLALRLERRLGTSISVTVRWVERYEESFSP